MKTYSDDTLFMKVPSDWFKKRPGSAGIYLWEMKTDPFKTIYTEIADATKHLAEGEMVVTVEDAIGRYVADISYDS